MPVSACFHHLAVVEHHYLMRMAHGAEAMGYHHHRLAVIEAVEILHDGTFAVGIERIGGFVEENVLRIAIYGACYEYALLLPHTQTGAIAAYASVVFQRK